MDVWGALLIILYAANLVSVFSLLFIDKKDTGTTFSWILVFVFLPWLGFLFYLFFGSTKKLKLFSKKYSLERLNEQYQKILEKNIDSIKHDDIRYNDFHMEKYKDIIELNAKNAESVYSQDNSVQLLINAKAKYEMMFREIEEAKESINVLYFIIKGKDESGKKFISLLAKKAREGVEVRLIYDTMGFMKTSRKDFKELEEAGGMVYGFLPSVLRTLLQANYRMHRKMVIIDGLIAYTGGINIGDDYLGMDPVKTPWRDTSIRLTGSCVQEIQLTFLSDWTYLDKQIAKKKAYHSKVEDDKHLKMYFKHPKEIGTTGVQVLLSGPDKVYTTIKDSYLKMINDAKRYVYIQTPYLVPDEATFNALRIAAQSGVDVRIMIPGIPDKKFVYYVSLSFVEELLRNGIKIYTYNGFIHAKTCVFDDAAASIGTANFDMRSFMINYEMNTMIYDSKFSLECKETFLNDIHDSTELSYDQYQKRSWLQKLRESFWRLVSPLA